LRIISWNLLRLTGAGVADVAALIEHYRPDLLLLQEATEALAALPAAVGGFFFREPLDGRVYGLAVWSPHPLPPPYALPLPASSVPGRVPPRVAQMVELHGVTFANVHLSHGQVLNRLQLLHIVRSCDGPAAVVGDYNAVGPIKLGGFKDIGPRQSTHSPNTMISFRLDRCMARGLRCARSRVLARGPSDHHPIMLDVVPEAVDAVAARKALRAARLGANAERWLRAMARAPERIRVPQGLLERLDQRLRAAGKAREMARAKARGEARRWRRRGADGAGAEMR
jgi:endonuclease/exonuclease/phosphatase family metal-dependent hydrolase